MGTLRVTNGPLAGKTIDVTGEVVIGRENASLEIDDPEVSRQHAAVRRRVGALEVEDLGSSNGTFVDGERIAGPTRIGEGALIRLGSTEIAVEDVVPSDATRARAVADPQATRAAVHTRAPGPDREPAELADPQRTRAKSPPPELAQPAAAGDAALAGTGTGTADGAASTATAGAVGTSKATNGSSSLQLGSFSPPARPRRRGLASRSWVPVALSFGTVLVVAVALVIYFATR
jgi:pSer/pThr/pTyr-binding forkhead associated (FHA) protein